MHPENSSSLRGSALLLVFWSIVLLSMSVFGVVEIVQSSVSHSAHLTLQSQARALAMSGLAVAMNPDIARDNSLLHQQPEPGQKWDVSIVGEAGRLNLNYVLLTGHRDILTRLFIVWGVDAGAAQQAADCLYDWVTLTPGDKPSPSGAKAADYRRAGLSHLPTGQPFGSLTETQWVIGMDAVAKVKPDWADSFTLWSDGPLDLNEAPADLISAVFNLPLSQTEAFTTKRNGHDGICGTADDITVPDAPTLKAALGLGDSTMKAVGDQIAFTDAIRRIDSKGKNLGVTVTISAVTRLKSAPPEYISWTEL